MTKEEAKKIMALNDKAMALFDARDPGYNTALHETVMECRKHDKLWTDYDIMKCLNLARELAKG
jgi:hypothetical protein